MTGLKNSPAAKRAALIAEIDAVVNAEIDLHIATRMYPNVDKQKTAATESRAAMAKALDEYGLACAKETAP